MQPIEFPSVVMTLELPLPVYEMAVALAVRDGVTVNNWINSAVGDCVQAGAETLVERLERAVFPEGVPNATD